MQFSDMQLDSSAGPEWWLRYSISCQCCWLLLPNG